MDMVAGSASESHDGPAQSTSALPAAAGTGNRKRKSSTAGDGDRIFKCDFQGCTKSFARSDHLSRHKLNHEPGQIFRCDRCPRTFVRPDLLKRHAERHDKRELNGHDPQPKPGRIKGTTVKKKIAPKGVGDQENGDTSKPPTLHDPLSRRQSIASTSQTLPLDDIVSHDKYDHTRLSSLLAPQGARSQTPTSPATALLDLYSLGNHQQSHYANRYPNGDNLAFAENSGYASSAVDRLLSAPTGPSELEQALLQAGPISFNDSDMDNSLLSNLDTSWLFNQDNSFKEQFAMIHEPQQALNRIRRNSLPHTFRSGNMNLPDRIKSFDGLVTSPESPISPMALLPQLWIPRITPGSRAALIEYLSAIPNLASNPLFDQSHLDNYLARFFEWDFGHYSLIHRATFEPDRSKPTLLAALVVIGCYYTDNEAHELSGHIYKIAMQTFITSADFRPRADIQTIQACLLLNLYGKTMSNLDSFEMAHILYPSFITLCKRSAVFSNYVPTVPDDADLQTRWLAWRDAEAFRRAAFMAFQFDIVCSTLFRQIATLSAFQIDLTLPSNENEWHAGSGSEWHRLYSTAPRPPYFLPTIKAFLMPGLSNPDISPLARVICLHGLISVASDMQWRENFLLGLSTHPDGLVKEWRLTLSSAYNCWKTRLDIALKSAPATFGAQLLRNSINLYAMAHITLSIDVQDLQVFAGELIHSGTQITPYELEAARRRIISWSGTSGKEAAWHSSHFLRSGLLHRQPIKDGVVRQSYQDWCLYIAALCLYAYSTTASLTKGATRPGEDEMPQEWVTYLDEICASTPNVIGPANYQSSLEVCDTVMQILQEDRRWELAQQAAERLSQLVGTDED